jgi:hypothetical protein
MVSPNTIHLPVVRSTEHDQIAVSASFAPQADVSDTETHKSTEESATTDDSVSPLQAVFNIKFNAS